MKLTGAKSSIKKLLGHVVIQRGTKTNLEKVRPCSILRLVLPKNLKV